MPHTGRGIRAGLLAKPRADTLFAQPAVTASPRQPACKER